MNVIYQYRSWAGGERLDNGQAESVRVVNGLNSGPAQIEVKRVSDTLSNWLSQLASITIIAERGEVAEVLAWWDDGAKARYTGDRAVLDFDENWREIERVTIEKSGTGQLSIPLNRPSRVEILPKRARL